MNALRAIKLFSSLKYAAANARRGEDVYPFYASFKINDFCGKQCDFCNVWRRPRKSMLSRQEILHILDNLADSSILVVSFEGGEPFLCKDLPEILSYAKKKGFITEVTTSDMQMDGHMLVECRKSLNFLHISIDDGHGNLEMLRDLPKFHKDHIHLAVQIVVTRDSLAELPDKIEAVHESNTAAIVMPAAHVEGTDNHYPDPVQFGETIRRLRKKYPGAILTSERFLRSLNVAGNGNGGCGCTMSSIIIDSDGKLYYPCYPRGAKPVSLQEQSLMDFLHSAQGIAARETASKCNKKCGWYQYFATPSCTGLWDLAGFLRMYAGFVFRSRLRRYKRANGKQSTV